MAPAAYCAAKGLRCEVICDLVSGLNYREKGLQRRLELILRRRMRRQAVFSRGCNGSVSAKACRMVNAALRVEETWRCPSCGVTHHRDANATLNLCRQGLAADVEGVSAGRGAALPDEASTRQIIPDGAR